MSIQGNQATAPRLREEFWRVSHLIHGLTMSVALMNMQSDTIADLEEKFGQDPTEDELVLDGIAHTVGGFASAAAAEGGPDLWEQMYRLNVLTTLNIFRAALPPMCAAGRGSLLAIGAGAAVKAPSGLGAYAGAKSAVHRLVESFADELKADRIRVNAILPSIIDTPQNRAAMPDADHTAWVRPREIADAIAFLLAEDASGVTGAFIPVSGRV